MFNRSKTLMFPYVKMQPLLKRAATNKSLYFFTYFRVKLNFIFYSYSSYAAYGGLFSFNFFSFPGWNFFI